VCLTLLVGVTPEAAVIVLYVMTFLSVLQHASVRRQRWLGMLVRRPESQES
jgi:hypothetical protein